MKGLYVMRNRRTVAAALLATCLAASAGACSSKTVDQDSGDGDAVLTGTGVEDGKITLGVLTDLSGPFAPIGEEVDQALRLYWDLRNQEGGICGQFDVVIDTKDNAYNVQTTTSLYSAMNTEVLAFQNVLGTAPVLALADRLAEDNMLAILHGQGAEVLAYDNILMTGATFPIEASNGLGYLLEQGLISDGDTVGHVYLEGSYGEGVLEGVKYFVDRHDMTLVEARITATTQDLTAAVTDFASKGVDVIVASTSPPQLASAAVAAEAEGLDVPILASTPAWTAGLLDTPAAPALTTHMYTAFPVSGFENPKAAEFREAYIERHPGTDPSLQIVLVYSEAVAMDAILERACANGDLTPKGVLDARNQIDRLTTEGVTPALDFTRKGRPVTAEEFITRAANVPGGLKGEKGPYASEDALAYFESLG